MTRWKKDAKEFAVKLTNDYAGSIICRVPKPIVEMLGNPSGLTFEVHGTKISVVAGDKK